MGSTAKENEEITSIYKGNVKPISNQQLRNVVDISSKVGQQWVGYSVSPSINNERVIYMLSILQFCIRFILALGTTLGIAFMVMCTALVIICVFCGDGYISIIIVKK
jgi:hypothetical protein